MIKSTCEESAFSNTNIPALKWSIDNHKNANIQYTTFQRNQGHKKFKISNCVLFLYLMVYNNVIGIQKKIFRSKMSIFQKETLNIYEAFADNFSFC